MRLFTILAAESVDDDHPAHDWFLARYRERRGILVDRLADEQREGTRRRRPRPRDASRRRSWRCSTACRSSGCWTRPRRHGRRCSRTSSRGCGLADGRPPATAARRHTMSRRVALISTSSARRRHQRLRHRAVALGLAQQRVELLLGRVGRVDGEAQAQGREAGADLAVEPEGARAGRGRPRPSSRSSARRDPSRWRPSGRSAGRRRPGRRAAGRPSTPRCRRRRRRCGPGPRRSRARGRRCTRPARRPPLPRAVSVMRAWSGSAR